MRIRDPQQQCAQPTPRPRSLTHPLGRGTGPPGAGAGRARQSQTVRRSGRGAHGSGPERGCDGPRLDSLSDDTGRTQSRGSTLQSTLIETDSCASRTGHISRAGRRGKKATRTPPRRSLPAQADWWTLKSRPTTGRPHCLTRPTARHSSRQEVQHVGAPRATTTEKPAAPTFTK